MFERFDIYFSGELVEGADPSEVRRSLCRMNGIDEAKAIRLLSGMPVRIKSDVDVETAGKYRASFRKIGVLIDIRPRAAETPARDPTTPPVTESRQPSPGKDTGSNRTPPEPEDHSPQLAGISVEEETEFELLPANTGSLEDCSIARPAQALPDISDMAIDTSDTALDDSPAPAPPVIDTSHLSAEPARVGNLEDCVLEKPVRPIPDISHLRLLD